MTPVRMRLAIAGIISTAVIAGSGIWLTAKPSTPPATSNATPFVEASPVPTARPFTQPGEMATPTPTAGSGTTEQALKLAALTTLRSSGALGGEHEAVDIGRDGRARDASVMFTPSRFAEFADGGRGPELWERRSDSFALLDAAGVVLATESITPGFDWIRVLGSAAVRLVERGRYGNSLTNVSPLRTIDLVVGGERRSLPSDGSWRLSPGGRWAANLNTTAGRGAIVFHDVPTKTERRVDLGPVPYAGGGDSIQIWYDFAPIWSPSGRFVRFAQFRADAKQDDRPIRTIVIVDADTGRVHTFDDACGGQIFVPIWAPDADRLVVPDGCEGQPRRAVLDARTGRVTGLPIADEYQLVAGGGVLLQHQNRVEILDASGKTAGAWSGLTVREFGLPSGVQAVITAGGPIVASPSADRDCAGTIVYLATDQRGRCIAARGAGRAHAVGWSNDGSLLAVIEVSPARESSPGSEVVMRVIDVRSSQEIAAAVMSVGPTNSLSWVPIWSVDGSRVLIYSFTFAP